MNSDISKIANIGEDLYLAIANDDLQTVTRFKDDHGVNARFDFTTDSTLGAWMRDSTILLAAIVAGSDRVAKFALDNGADLSLGEYNVEAMNTAIDVHPLTAALNLKRTGIIPLLAEQDIDFNITLAEVQGSSYQSRMSLKDAVEEIPGSHEYLQTLNLGHLLESSHQLSTLEKRRSPGSR